MRRRSGGWVAVLVSLIIVGVVRAAVPLYLPQYSYVGPNSDGVVELEEATLEVLDARATDRLQSDKVEGATLSTEEVFVVVRVEVTPHGRTMDVTSELQTSDGRTYMALSVPSFPTDDDVFVGQRATQTHIFEVPSDSFAGSHLSVRGAGADGVQGIQPSAWFPLEVTTVPGTVKTVDNVVEPTR